jgi:hypothetical protein
MSHKTKHSFWGYIRCWNGKIFLAKMLNSRLHFPPSLQYIFSQKSTNLTIFFSFHCTYYTFNENEVSPQSFNYWQYQWIKAWNTTGNNTNNYTIRVWMIIFCFQWTVQSNLFMFDIVCHLLNFPQNLLSLFTVCMDL